MEFEHVCNQPLCVPFRIVLARIIKLIAQKESSDSLNFSTPRGHRFRGIARFLFRPWYASSLRYHLSS